MHIKVADKSALDLMMRGTNALAQIERTGIKIDVDYLKEADRKTGIRIKKLQHDLEKDAFIQIWKKKYRSSFNLGSEQQLGELLVTECGCTLPVTETGKPSTSIESLEGLVAEVPFLEKYLWLKKLSKASGTFIKGILSETVDGFLHPNFNLHFVRSYRSSSTNPNFQNFPVRDKRMAQLIRSAFIPRKPTNHLVECDYSGIEVKVAACYHKDPVMMEYILDESKDMHRDMAMECYLLNRDQVTKDIRYCGKNKFVFPQFYGDYFANCAIHLWQSIDLMGLKTGEGVPLKEHLAKHGIKSLGSVPEKGQKPQPGTFMKHLSEVEHAFWYDRFKQYAKWKKRWWETYQKNGYFESLTGFIYQGAMRRNEVINYAVQGSAFHCLLLSVIKMQEALKKEKMKSVLIGQIHDSMLGDVPHDELRDFYQLAKYIMEEVVREYWKWIIVPIPMEADVAPMGKSWFEKKEFKL